MRAQPEQEQVNQATNTYEYTMNLALGTIEVHTDPAGLWRAGVAATVWDSSLILAKHFEKMLAESHTELTIVPPSRGIQDLLNKPALQVLELGAGCSAIPTLVLASYASSNNARVSLDNSKGVLDDEMKAQNHRCFTVTDKLNALPLLRKTIETQTDKLSSMIRVEELDWQALCHDAKDIQATQWDLIIASDLLAFPELYESLVAILSRLSGVSTVIYIAYERRNFAAEIEFFRLLGEAFTFEMVLETELDEIWRAPGEIYLYRARRRQRLPC